MKAGSRPVLWQIVLLAAGLGLTVLVYAPGLYGGYILDDFGVIINNRDIHVSSLDPSEWIRAALSFRTNHQIRALTMITFAGNYFLSGLDPFWMKVTNLCIHLINGLLVFFVIGAILRFWCGSASPRGARYTQHIGNVAFAIALAWLLLPVHVSAVLYVAQRMELLSNTFVLLGLYWYVKVRRRHWRGQGGLPSMILALVTCTGIGILAKESAALLPLYAACFEIALTQFRNSDGRHCRGLLWLYVVVIILPAFVGGLWLLSWIGGPMTYERSFTTVERLLTEARVLVNYIHWVIIPSPNALGLYHDDIVVSRSLTEPPTTILAVLALAGLFAIAIWQRRQRPLLTLGILWFFAGHALTGTVIPLEIVFEHRNYCSSIGLLLAAGSLLALEPGLTSAAARVTVSMAALFFYGSQTALAARDWSNSERLTAVLVQKNPLSPRAQNEFATALLAAASKSDEPMTSRLVQQAREALETAGRLSDNGIVPEARLIILAAERGEPARSDSWQSILAKLERHPPDHAGLAALGRLVDCQRAGICKKQTEQLLGAFHAALNHPRTSSSLMRIYARFAADALGAHDVAVQVLRVAIKRNPNSPGLRMDLVRYLIRQGHWKAASLEIAALRQLSYLGYLDSVIADMDNALASARSNGMGVEP